MKLEQSDVVEALYSVFPYPHQIKELNFKKDPMAVYFNWRDNTFKIEIYSDVCFSVHRADRGMLVGDDVSVLLAALIKPAVTQILVRKDTEVVR